jgi:hypothetical protein
VVNRSIAVVAMLLLAASGAWAAPSLFGPTGLMVIPSAEVVGMAGVNGQWAQISFDSADETIVSANVGPLPKLEVGAAHLEVDHGGSETIINAKYQVLRPPLIDTAISAGVIDITDEIDVSPYLVLTHTLGVGYFPTQSGLSNPQVHVGIGGGMLSGLFLGASVTVLDKLELMAEYDTEDLNIGARLPLTSWLVVTAAGLDGLDDFAIAAAAQTPF